MKPLNRSIKSEHRIDAVILDAGGVILYPNLDWLISALKESPASVESGEPINHSSLLRGYYRTIYDLDLDPTATKRGPAFTDLETRRWFFTHMFLYSGQNAELANRAGDHVARLALEQFPRESDIYSWAIPEIRRVLESLVDAGFLLGSASNNDGALEAQLTNLGVVDLFGTLKDSGKEGVAKPDPELLLRAARDLNVAPAHCLYVGDVDRVDGAAARAAGMSFALLDPLNQPRPSSPLCIPELYAILPRLQ